MSNRSPLRRDANDDVPGDTEGSWRLQPRRLVSVNTPLSPAPLIYAHRGDRAHARDNTIDAFEMAIANGADGCRARCPAQPRTTAWSSTTTNRIQRRGPIAAVRFDELQRIDPQVPDLAAVFDAVGGRCYINIEIKNAPGPWFDRNRRVADEVPVVVAAHGVGESILVSSFDAMSVRKVKERGPQPFSPASCSLPPTRCRPPNGLLETVTTQRTSPLSGRRTLPSSPTSTISSSRWPCGPSTRATT